MNQFPYSYQDRDSLLPSAMTAAAAWGTILSEKDVWLWQHDPAECFHAFLQVADRYDAIICPNDVISICLINECKKQGIDIPGMLYLASFGNMSLGSYFRPTITSISMDMLRVGEQTFNVWRYLLTSGTPSITSLKITVPSRILVRESTGMPLSLANSIHISGVTTPSISRQTIFIANLRSLMHLL